MYNQRPYFHFEELNPEFFILLHLLWAPRITIGTFQIHFFTHSGSFKNLKLEPLILLAIRLSNF